MNDDIRPQLATLRNPTGAVAEAYRVLRSGLDFINFEDDIKVLLVTSAAPSEGKSTVSANLAVLLAQAGRKTMLISGDFRRPANRQFQGLAEAHGLSDVLRGRANIRETLQQPPGLENLWVMPAGSRPPNPSELLGSATMVELIEKARELADWVIVDSPPVLAVADASVAARWSDGVLMVSRAGVSKRREAERTREMLANAGARVVGVVVWGLKERAARNAYLAAYGIPPEE